MNCPKCNGYYVKHFFRFCPQCGERVEGNPEERGVLTFDQENRQRLIDNGTIKPVSDAEWSRFVLRALRNYHERITMGHYPELDCWKQGLEFAISCVEEKIEK